MQLPFPLGVGGCQFWRRIEHLHRLVFFRIADELDKGFSFRHQPAALHHHVFGGGIPQPCVSR